MSIQDLATLQAQVAALVSAQTETQRTLTALTNNRPFNVEPVVQLTPCSSGITTENQINLEVFKTLPIFDGDKKKYRAWRSSAWTHMETIKPFQNTPTYYTALAIVRAKIQGVAADILINHNTIFNFYSIINRLDYTYADQRPMYVLFEEMKKISQGRKDLAEYHSCINEALNLILSKIEMEQGDKTMKTFANQEAVRTFITGLNSKYTVGTLYAQNPKDLETAYSIASTIYHDDKHLQFDSPSHRPHPMSHQPNQQKTSHFGKNRYRPNIQYNPNRQPPSIQGKPQVQPMEVDLTDRNIRQPTQFRENSQRYNNPFRQQQPFKREFNHSHNNFNFKQQRINHTQEEDETNSIRAEYDENEDNKVAFFRLKDGLPHLQRHDRETGKTIHILIDSGATNNYIDINCKIGYSKKLEIPIKVKTLHGYSYVKSKKLINLLNYELTFFEIDSLTSSDMILGMQGLREIGATIDLVNNRLNYKCKEKMHKINFTVDNEKYRERIEEIMNKNLYTNEKLPYTTTIEGTIRTKSEEPIWTKQYPYPYSDNEFINKEIQDLLHNEIIQPSKSPYNSPIWTVAKKGTDDQGKPKRRMVVDFQKLNAQTITDRYPIPDVNMTIQNLGKAKIFTTLDLESGFHQIKIKEEDREKTAFSINGAKYEFLRMPFGLKNAPSIFQRCVDDILRPYIGKFAYVYIDDVLIYSSTPEEHIEHIETIVNALHKANMKISNEKSHFFKEEIEYLGHIIKHNGITVDPKKIQTIRNYPNPTTLKELRSFLGLASYYRKFIKNFAAIVKPLTTFLRGENGSISKNQSAKVNIKLDQPALDAMKRIKDELEAQVQLFQPDFKEPFELTTDASNFAIGAVLSQKQRPISFISRTLNETEQNYSTNEKELLAIVWALQKLRNYLYGIADLTIYTDHQSLIFSISDKNPNTKLKRWKNFIEEYGAKILYKPGHQNVVADALSRQQINSSSNESQHSTQSSPIEKIQRSLKPLNHFKNQIILTHSHEDSLESKNVFKFKRHHIKFTTNENLISNIKLILKPKVINALLVDAETMFNIKDSLKETFPTIKFVEANNLVEDILDEERQKQLVKKIHERAHRNVRNNILELERDYFWPDLKKHCHEFNNNCESCLTHKYDRKPNKIPIGEAPIPTKPGENIHMDIFYFSGQMYITSLDKFSKFCHIRHIPTKKDMYKNIDEVLSLTFPNAKFVVTDNEASFNGILANQIYERLHIQHVVTPPFHSTTNGQVERIHSTIIELANLLSQKGIVTPNEKIFEAVRQYNKTIHSVTKEKPEDVFFNQQGYPHIYDLIKNAQTKTLAYHNKERKFIHYKKGDIIYARTHRRNKDVAKFAKHIVDTDNGETITTSRKLIIHKDNIRSKYVREDSDITINDPTHNSE